MRKKPQIERPFGSKAGKPRYNVIKAAMDRYGEAFQAGYYVECIALIEGLLADRLESLANEITQTPDYSYNTLGALACEIKKKHASKLSDELQELLPELEEWAKRRNMAVHVLPKLLPNANETFEKRYKSLRKTASDGKKLFAKLSSAIRRYRAEIKKGIRTI